MTKQHFGAIVFFINQSPVIKNITKISALHIVLCFISKAYAALTVLFTNSNKTTTLISGQEFFFYDNYNCYIKSHFNKYTKNFHKVCGFIGTGEQLLIDTLIENEYKYLFTKGKLYKNKY